jgi:hypothetical protein
MARSARTAAAANAALAPRRAIIQPDAAAAAVPSVVDLIDIRLGRMMLTTQAIQRLRDHVFQRTVALM